MLGSRHYEQWTPQWTLLGTRGCSCSSHPRCTCTNILHLRRQLMRSTTSSDAFHLQSKMLQKERALVLAATLYWHLGSPEDLRPYITGPCYQGVSQAFSDLNTLPSESPSVNLTRPTVRACGGTLWKLIITIGSCSAKMDVLNFLEWTCHVARSVGLWAQQIWHGCLCLENKMVMDLVGLGTGQSVEGAATVYMPKLNVFMVG
jgi:hypothetical protein